MGTPAPGAGVTDLTLVLALLGVFAAGIAVGRALERAEWQEAVGRLWDWLEELS